MRTIQRSQQFVARQGFGMGDYVRVPTLAKNINRRGVYAFKKYRLQSGFLRRKISDTAIHMVLSKLG